MSGQVNDRHRKGWKGTGPLIALAAAAAALAMLAQAANSAGLPTAAITGLRGALGPDGMTAAVVTAVGQISAALPVIPTHPLRTALVLLHVAGLTAGMGAALFLDFFLLSRLYGRPVDSSTADLLEFGSRIVSGGLILLWLTGLGLFAFYYFEAPFALQNPKLIAKVTAVSALTLNGFVLHALVLPWVRRRQGQPLLSGLPLMQSLPIIAVGITSGVSWAFCCVLGMVKELNGVVPASTLVECYFSTLGLCIAAAAIGHLVLGKPQQTRSQAFSTR